MYVGYAVSRVLADDSLAPAVGRAVRILDLERALGLDVEAGLNRWLLEHDALGVAASFYYAGAHYLVTPTMNLDVIELALQQQVAIFPGGFSPTELAAGWAAGATAVKIFPAQTVGAGYLKHLRGPFPDLQAVPSGGVDLDATKQWLAAGAAAVSIGGPLLGDALAGGDPSKLRQRCRAVTAAVAEAAAP